MKSIAINPAFKQMIKEIKTVPEISQSASDGVNKIVECLRGGRWKTASDISNETNIRTVSISNYIKRAIRHGHKITIEKTDSSKNGITLYRMIV